MKFDLGAFNPNNDEDGSVTSCATGAEDRIWSDKEKANWSDWTIIISWSKKRKSLQDVVKEEKSCFSSNNEEKKIDNIISPYNNNNDEDEDDDNNKKITYHVHRSQLASGRRKSEYFKTLFEQQGNGNNNSRAIKTIECIDCTSIIEFENESSLLAFPIMLDYLYSSSSSTSSSSSSSNKDCMMLSSSSFTTETATALRYLSNYFIIQDLFNDVNMFIQDDMKDNNNVETYLSESYEYKDEKLLEAASKFINEKFDIVNDVERILSLPTVVLMSGHVSNMVVKLAENFELVEIDQVLTIPLDLLKMIISCSSFAYDSNRLSVTMYEYIKVHNIEDKGIIHTLTSSDIMPTIDPNCALDILDMIEGITQQRSNLIYKSLFNRCVESITLNWKDILVVLPKEELRHQQQQQCSISDCDKNNNNINHMKDKYNNNNKNNNYYNNNFCNHHQSKYKNISSSLMNNLLFLGMNNAKKNYDELIISSQKKYDNLVELFQLLLVATAQKENNPLKN